MREATMTGTQDESDLADSEVVAGNGLLNRRYFLRGGAAAAGGLVSLASVSARAETLTVPEWMKQPGEPFVAYGQPSHYEKVGRSIGATQATSPGSGASRSPLQSLNGMITPNGLHYERSHNGVPDIDPDAHRLLIHGLVKQQLTFTVDALSRYPMTSRISFVECAGNGGALWAKQPVIGTAATLQGLVSCAEWTGVSLSLLLDEAGVDPKAQWLLAEGADAVGMSRSVPLAKARDDAIIALYQNGERIRPSNGYPMRLLLPGYEGNMNVKWLRRIKMIEGPMMTRDETSRYSILLQDGRVAQFKFPMDAKSVITQPSPGLTMNGPGFYEISGIAWSGNGKVAKVEVSADGGASWAEAALSEPVLSKAVTRFRMPWRWSGGPVVLMSRATDETGYVQPSRDALIAERGAKGAYHYNGVTSWGVSQAGEISHVYA
jgi:sulfane dehydrogenase subunit SoxC